MNEADDSPAGRSFAIVPAAGRSRRMGVPKLLLPWGSARADGTRPCVIEVVLAAWRASRVTQVVVVVHPDDLELAAICQRSGAQVVVADPPPIEMKDSVQRGLEFVSSRWQPEDRDAWLLAPADMPLLSAAAIDRVLGAQGTHPGKVLVPQHDGRRGHPVLFPWPLAGEVSRLGSDQGLNALVRAYPVKEIEFAEDAVLADLDTPADVRRLTPHAGL